ncbi:MAG: transketolase [Clostridiaceae bacterium]|nr:transketolase [Clostridiaceae bacterium]
MEKSTHLQLKLFAARMRKLIIEGVYSAQSGHPGGSLSSTEIFAYLYGSKMRVDPATPENPDRDRFVLSKGHCAPGLYAALSQRGFFDPCNIKDFRKCGSMLQGHPCRACIPGVDMSTGSLGQGISTAVGMAMMGKLDKKDYRVYSILGDGELQEGQVWEALMSAAHYKLDNLSAFIDFNGLQIDGKTDDVMSLGSIEAKVSAFGWHMIPVDGHDFEAIEAAVTEAENTKGKPTMVVAKTHKGKGVSFMEDQAGWHGKAPNQQEYEQAMAELDATLAELEVQA